MPKVIVVRRSHDFMAHLEGQPEKWECSANPFAAIGMLVVSRQKELGVDVDMTTVSPALAKSR
jgi:hypothetical protein